MAEFSVPSGKAKAVRRQAGITITFVNQSTTTDVYFDRQEERLDRTVTGSVPNGTQLAKNGGQLQWPNFPGVLWFRAASDTTIEVTP
jgi:hypothetical protein